MTPFSLVYPLHVLSALVWVGGMFFAWMVLRPAAVKALDGPARLTLWVEVFQGFFRWVWVAVILLPIIIATTSRTSLQKSTLLLVSS